MVLISQGGGQGLAVGWEGAEYIRFLFLLLGRRDSFGVVKILDLGLQKPGNYSFLI